MKQYNSLQDVAEVLKNGTIAVIPTETVYGLAATVFDDNAVKKIFEKKRRPADNPLIVHLSHRDQIDSIAIVENELERKLIDLWMPGPFTILLKKKEIISDLVTAGSDLVAVRVPSHPLAQQLLEKVGVPLAAPSANPSGKPSPTSAEMAHFYFPELKILDGGACHTGIESTVVYVDGSEVVVMRPGLITAEDMRDALGGTVVVRAVATKTDLVAPGMKYKHYAPSCGLEWLDIRSSDFLSGYAGKKIGLLCSQEMAHSLEKTFFGSFFIWGIRSDLLGLAQKLFLTFHEADKLGLDLLLIEKFDTQGVGLALMNRVKKAMGL